MLKKKRFLAISLSLLMVGSLAACSKKAEETTVDATPTPTEVATATPEPTQAAVEEFVGIDFEDGVFDFVQINTSPGDADKSIMSVVDYNGSKQLFVDVQSFKVPYVAFDVASLVGDRIADVRSIEMDVTTVSADGVFRAVAGKVVAYSGEKLTESKDDWSVYLESKNPNKAEGTLDNEGEYFVAGAKNYFALTKVTDNGKDVVDQPADLYIDNVVIRDAAGKAIPVDTTVKFDKPAGFGEEDWSNLTKVKDEVEIEGFNVAAGGWAQAGVATVAGGGSFDVSLLKPGTILTINYTAPEGNVWLVAVPAEGAPFAWTRIQQQTAVKNDSNSVCQITYEQIVEALGTEDLSGLVQLQAEGDVEWSVSKVTIGVESVQLPATMGDVEIEGFAVAAGGWSQAGVKTVANGGTFDPALLVPGSVVTITYKSEGPIWLVANPLEGAAFPWTRIEQGTAARNDENTVAQITYEQIVAALGTEDLSLLGELQCESEFEWEVYSVKIGQFAPSLVKVKDAVEIEGFAVAAGGWAQAGVATTVGGGTFDATSLKPGCIVTIKYKSTGPVWLVAVPQEGASFPWTRIAQGVAAKNADNTVCQITYDQIVTALGTEDFAAGLNQLQVEGEQEWEVYSVSIGYPAEQYIAK